MRGAETAILATRLVDGVLEGRGNADLLLAISGSDNLEIDASNKKWGQEMGSDEKSSILIAGRRAVTR